MGKRGINEQGDEMTDAIEPTQIKGATANRLGFDWDIESVTFVLELRGQGFTREQIAEAMTEKYGRPFTRSSVCHAVRQYGRLNLTQPPPEIKTYLELTLPMDDYIISCDYHAPFYSAEWVNRLLLVAAHFKIKKSIIIGDLFDMEFASHFPPKDGQQSPSLDAEIGANSPLMAGFDYFDEIIILNGNHERRIGILTASKVQARHLNILLGGEVWRKKVVFSEYDKLNIEDKWLLVHPKSYSQISGAVATRLAEKYHRHVLNAHGHFTAIRWDRSGKFMGIDMGGLFDVSKVAYKQFQTTTHPEWNPGFGMLLNEHFHLFDNSADWGFWLGATKPMRRIKEQDKPEIVKPEDLIKEA